MCDKCQKLAEKLERQERWNDDLLNKIAEQRALFYEAYLGNLTKDQLLWNSIQGTRELPPAKWDL